MTITAKFQGTCKKCGGKIAAGEQIEWSKGQGSQHITCPAVSASNGPAKAAPTPADPNAIKISQGSGYGGREYHPGQVLRHAKHGLIIVVSASKRYFREEDEGMSFGVGDESGYIYSATCRPATEAEAAPLLAAEAAREKIIAAKKAPQRNPRTHPKNRRTPHGRAARRRKAYEHPDHLRRRRLVGTRQRYLVRPEQRRRRRQLGIKQCPHRRRWRNRLAHPGGCCAYRRDQRICGNSESEVSALTRTPRGA